MSYRRLVLGLATVAIAAGCLVVTTTDRPPAEAADVRSDRADSGEHDFGDAVVVFNLEYEDDLVPAVPWAFVHAGVRRLGNVFFLTGVEPDAIDGEAPRHWIPLADIVRMTEYDSLDAARQAVEATSGTHERERPVVHRAVRRGRGTAR